MGVRPERVGEQLRVELSRLVLRELKDPRVGFATITEVRVSPDLRHAKVYVSVMGDEEERAATLEALEHAEGFLRGQLGRRMRLRHVPELSFVIDDTLDRSERIDELLAGDKEAGGDSGENSDG